MKLINLDKPMLSIKGEPIKGEKPFEGIRNIIANEVKAYNPVSAEETLAQVKKWKETLKTSEESPMLLRDYILMILGSRFTIKDKRENFWTTDLGIQISSEKNRIVEIEDSKFDFLKRIMEENTIIVNDKPRELFFPYEVGQIIKAFEENVEVPAQEEKSEAKKKPKE